GQVPLSMATMTSAKCRERHLVLYASNRDRKFTMSKPSTIEIHGFSDVCDFETLERSGNGPGPAFSYAMAFWVCALRPDVRRITSFVQIHWLWTPNVSAKLANGDPAGAIRS